MGLIGEEGVAIEHCYRLKEDLLWSKLKSLWINDGPSNVAEAIIAPLNKKVVPVSQEIALEVPGDLRN